MGDPISKFFNDIFQLVLQIFISPDLGVVTLHYLIQHIIHGGDPLALFPQCGFEVCNFISQGLYDFLILAICGGLIIGFGHGGSAFSGLISEFVHWMG
jgi:hypothetical protein